MAETLLRFPGPKSWTGLSRGRWQETRCYSSQNHRKMSKMGPKCITVVVFVVTMRIALPQFRDHFLSHRYYANSRGIFQGKSPSGVQKQGQNSRVLTHGDAQQAARRWSRISRAWAAGRQYPGSGCAEGAPCSTPAKVWRRIAVHLPDHSAIFGH